MTKILYLHGFGARPGGFKPTFLQQRGYEVVNPLLPDDDFDQSLQNAREAFAASHPDVVVGSSRGGAVALGLELGDTPLVLIAPAWKRWGTAARVGPRTIILHAPADDLIPVGDSRELAANSGLAPDALVLVGRDHFMGDDQALAALVAAIESLRRG
ncbi:MAG: alpha/beta hydrolase [Planctomycetaceae bacterium]|nr:alpha/beta hydrolase [Planctomycetaceae bacterium]